MAPVNSAVLSLAGSPTGESFKPVEKYDDTVSVNDEFRQFLFRKQFKHVANKKESSWHILHPFGHIHPVPTLGQRLNIKSVHIPQTKMPP